MNAKELCYCRASQTHPKNLQHEAVRYLSAQRALTGMLAETFACCHRTDASRECSYCASCVSRDFI